jgi:peptidoglycan hydrolase CwlO-like protein
MYPAYNEREDLQSFERHLSQISAYINNEIAGKQATILRLQQQLQELTDRLGQKDGQLENLQQKLDECKENTEGQRQLMNKLLNDIGNYQKDLLWYRKTYEQRSLLGILKDKLFRHSGKEL